MWIRSGLWMWCNAGLGMCGLKNGDFLAIVQRSFDTYLLLVVGVRVQSLITDVLRRAPIITEI